MRATVSDLPLAIEEASVRVPGLTILDRVSLTFSPGSPTALIGPNGSGKTTLLRLAMGLIVPSDGRVTYAGRRGVPPRRRAILFQRPAMLHRSAAANIHYALSSIGVRRAQAVERTEELLAMVGLSGAGGRPARRLSGGEQQRLALARALAREPELIFLDEPTASLDPAATKTLEDVVRQVAGRGVKVVMSTHDLASARRLAGEIVLMHRGCVVETGAAQSFFAEPKTNDGRRFVAGELLI